MRRTHWLQVDWQEGIKADLKDSSLSNWAEVMRFPGNKGEAGFRKGTFYLGHANLDILEDVSLEFRDDGGKMCSSQAGGWSLGLRVEGTYME